MERGEPDADEGLGPRGEAEWERLRAELDLAHGFWLGFVFAPSPRSVIVLRERTERMLRTQTRKLWLFRPERPEELFGVLPLLLGDGEATRAGCAWVEAVRSDSPGASEQPWTRAWDELFLRTNERRNALREGLPGGLVFAAPPGIKPRVREAAPDLWSVRALVIDLAPVARGATAGVTGSSVEIRREARGSEVAGATSDPDAVLAEAARRGERGAVVAQARALLRATEGLLGYGRTVEAREAALRATALLRGANDLDEANALALLAKVEAADGDPAAAADHIERALRLHRGFAPDTVPLEWFRLAINLARDRSDLQVAMVLASDAEATARQGVRNGGDADAMRNLSLALGWVGERQWDVGDGRGAAVAFEESLAIDRQLRELRGETPEALRDLSVTLGRIGNLRREAGDGAGAAATFEESLAIARRVCELQGETPEALRDISISLQRVGDIRRDSGDAMRASAAFEESLAIRRRLYELQGETPEALRDLALSLAYIGDVRRDAGNRTAAGAAFEESFALWQQLRERCGETPHVLRDQSVLLERAGDLRREAGDRSGAAAAFEASLAIRRRLRELRGETPETLRDICVSLGKIGGLAFMAGELDAAAASLDEATRIGRCLIARYGGTPTHRRAGRVSLRNLAKIHRARGDEPAALAAEAEAATLEADAGED